jgi:hypothetical protein
MFPPNRDEIAGGWGQLNNMELIKSNEIGLRVM